MACGGGGGGGGPESGPGSSPSAASCHRSSPSSTFSPSSRSSDSPPPNMSGVWAGFCGRSSWWPTGSTVARRPAAWIWRGRGPRRRADGQQDPRASGQVAGRDPQQHAGGGDWDARVGRRALSWLLSMRSNSIRTEKLMWKHYFQNTQGLIFVEDSNERDSRRQQ